MYPAGFYEEEAAEDLALEFGVPVSLARLVILVEESEEDIPKREERLLLLVKCLFDEHVVLTNDHIVVIYKVVRLLANLMNNQ